MEKRGGESLPCGMRSELTVGASFGR
jgi:hypothetical protein